jgi:hypothetical protein
MFVLCKINTMSVVKVDWNKQEFTCRHIAQIRHIILTQNSQAKQNAKWKQEMYK